MKIEVETYKLKIRELQGENKLLRKASVDIQMKAEQEVREALVDQCRALLS